MKAGRLGDRRSRAVSGETQFSSINAQLPANNVITGAFKLLRDAYEPPSPSALALDNASSSSVFLCFSFFL